MGEETRKEKVTPRGIPASIKPIKRGTAEQEQKGVTIPSNAAKMFPRKLGTLSKRSFVFPEEKSSV